MNYVYHLVGMKLSWEVKVKGQGQGHQNIKNKQICDNFGSNHRKMLLFILSESSSKIRLYGSAN